MGYGGWEASRFFGPKSGLLCYGIYDTLIVAGIFWAEKCQKKTRPKPGPKNHAPLARSMAHSR